MAILNHALLWLKWYVQVEQSNSDGKMCEHKNNHVFLHQQYAAEVLSSPVVRLLSVNSYFAWCDISVT